MLSAVDNNSVEAIYRVHITKILDSKREMRAQGKPIKKPSMSPNRLQL